MSHDKSVKSQAIRLRKKGMSIPAIATRLDLSKSTIWLWTKDIRLSDIQLQTLAKSATLGRNRGRDVLRVMRQNEQEEQKQNAQILVQKVLVNADIDFWKMMAATLFWCEGGKRELTSLRFANSDPQLVQLFLKALRTGFRLDEKKFHALLHLHEFHEDSVQKAFWSHITGIPVVRFAKSYQKPHTGKRKREGYQGCISIRYNQAALARTLDALYHALGKTF